MSRFMAESTRSWPALAALGAALLYGAVGAGAVGHAGPAPLTLVVGVLWLVVAVSQALYGLVALRSGSTPAPAVALALFLLPTLLWAALLLAGLGADAPHSHAGAGAATLVLPPPGAVPLPFLPLLLASVLALGVAVQSALRLRRLAGSERSVGAVADSTAHAAPAGGRFTLGLVVGSLAVSALVTPGLAATDAGRLAVPHGTHALGAAATVAAAPLSPAATAGTR